MTAWAQLLHFYQPPTQTHDVLTRVANESYRPLLQVLREHPGARLAINVNAVLTEMLADHGLGDVVDGLRELGERGQAEYVGSGRYHPILPLIPAAERARSLAENGRVNRRLLGESYSPAGFFPPEMCWSGAIAAEIAAAGHEWVVLSGVACPTEWPTDLVYRTPANGRSLRVLFRDDVRSNRISFRETSPEQFLADLARVGGGRRAYVVTAMDAETYGHHIRGWEREFLAATYAAVEAQAGGRVERGTSRVRMVTPSEVVQDFPAGPLVEPFPSSWSTSRDDIAALNPYPLWQAPGNRVHALQWEYVHHCLDLLTAGQRYAESDEARKHAAMAGDLLQPALHSCQFWWASRRPMWDATMVHRGFQLLNGVLLNAMRAVHLGTASARMKQELSWRFAAANELRTQLERHLFLDVPL
ncbi:MAG: hypothetical protein IT304_11390 [Dehalococcoidia bacterium]|nr:hypothetical protein [Dehalococcoidia bacterium]